jgi:hypothetical protein
MCCFSQPVAHVGNTKIFVCPEDSIRQFVVYSMSIKADKELAMVLPLPVRVGTGEDGVRFINLTGYKDLFDDVEKGFQPRIKPEIRAAAAPVPSAAPTLIVHDVGSFEASFVPTVNDFSRLDERFQLPPGTLEKLPAYRTYGFAVFKLKPEKVKHQEQFGRYSTGTMTFHPMAFSFPRANLGTLFFPTVHIHDGKVHDKADFDHVLYCQNSPNGRPSLKDWRESFQIARDFIKMDWTEGIVAGYQHCYRKELKGSLPNRDIVLS